MRRLLKSALLCFSLIWLLPIAAAPSESWRELLDRADSLSNAANYDSALVLGTLALERAEAEFGSSDTAVALALDALGAYHYHQADYDSAEELWSRALRIREKALGPEHHLVAKTLHNLATLYDDQGKYAESEPLHQRALTIREKVLGRHHQDVAASLVNLGNLYYHQGKYREATRYCKRALAIFEKALGPDHPNVASSALNLADLYYEQGNYHEAEPSYRRALDIAEKSFGSEHPYVAICRNNLANLYYEQGNYEESEKNHKQALNIFETALGPDHPYVGYSMNSLGDLYHRQGRYGEAEQCFRRALSINEKTLGADHPETAYSLNKLADLYGDQDKHAEAEPLLERALTIFRKAVGEDHQDVAMGLNNLANLRRDQGGYAEAETLYTQALQVFEKALGPFHPKVALCLESFSLYYRLKGDLRKGLDMAKRAFEIRRKNFRDGSSVMSEKDALNYSQFMRNSANNFLSAYFDMNGEDRRLDYDAADVMFSVKGRASEAVFVRAREIIMLDQLGAMADSLRYARTFLSKLYVEGSEEEDPLRHREQLDAASRDKDRLEGELARNSDSFRNLQDVLDINTDKVADILSLLPVTAMLVEYMKYDYLPIHHSDSVISRYMVVTLNGFGEISVKDLGEASAVDSLIDQYREHVVTVASIERMPSIVERTDYERISKSIHQRIWKPIEDKISGQDLVFIAPDAGMNILSFAGLMDEQGNYLIEGFTIHYLSSGRDLVRLKYEGGAGKGLFVLGDPDYDAPPKARISISEGVAGDTLPVETYGSTRNVRTACAELRGITLNPLPGTKSEVQRIRDGWDAAAEPATVCLGVVACEEKFKKEAPGNRVIHLATHGYFLEDECQPAPSQRGAGAEAGYVGENPLLLSGLFLAGANLHGQGADEVGAEDGILTAEEVTAMNLGGTELVVLSACETGLGEVKDGEGVYGLRRAFQMAGARTVVSALWPVSDQATAEMMSQLYGSSRKCLPETMREIQLEKIQMLRENKQADHPFSWGAFIALGDWR
jgi:CHAT domain-containing protein/tetratricopeptide (TPR) repeat protein